MVEVVAAQRRVAAGRQHLEDALRELQDRDVEGAAAEVVDGVNTFGGVVQPVGERRRGRLVQQPQHVQAGQPRRVAGRLPLRVVEVGRHRHHRADQLAAERFLGAPAQRLQDLGRHLDRTLDARHGLDLQHARRIDEVVRQVLHVGDILDAAAHEALHRDDRVARVARLVCLRRVPDLGPAVGQIADDRRQQRPPLVVAQHLGQPVANGRHQRIGGAQIDAHRQPVLVRRGRLARLGDLQQRHQCPEASAPSVARWAASSSRKRSMKCSSRTPAAAST
jgi:hypothetical protein